MIALIAALWFATPQAQDVVARIHGKAVLRSEAPGGDALFATVVRAVTQDFARERHVRVTDRELRQYQASLRRHMEQMRQERRAELARLQRELDATTDDDKHAELEREVARLQQFIESDERMPAGVGDRVARQVLLGYKLNQALWRRYGGRVIFQQLGPEPLDAYRALLLDAQKRHDFELVDQTYAAAFWDYVTNEKMHTFYPEPEARRLMTTKWWLGPLPADATTTSGR